eukprot:5782992-Amphidinium_carterae.2
MQIHSSKLQLQSRRLLSHWNWLLLQGGLCLTSRPSTKFTAVSTPHSGKIQATLSHQTPEFFDRLMKVIQTIKSGSASSQALTQTQSQNAATTVSIVMTPGDEIVVKKSRTQ